MDFRRVRSPRAARRQGRGRLRHSMAAALSLALVFSSCLVPLLHAAPPSVHTEATFQVKEQCVASPVPHPLLVC